MNISWIREKVQSGQYDLSAHAHRERQEEQITTAEIEKVLLKGSIIEEYPNDPRGESCLVGAKVAEKQLHVVCAKRNDRLLIVTEYRPKPPIWINYKTRAKELKNRV